MSTRQSPPAAGHDWAAELLAALLDGELDETTAAAVTAHVQECAECSRDWAELRATKQLLAALPAARAPRSYAILADDLAEPGRAGATFWPRLLGLTWRLSGALAVVIILIGTMQLAGINLGGEAETQYIQAEPQAAPARPAGELGATELPAAQQAAAPAAPAGPRGERAAAGAAGPAGQTIVVEKERPVVVEKEVGEGRHRREAGCCREGRREGCGRREDCRKASGGGRCGAGAGPDRHSHRHANSQPHGNGNYTADGDSRDPHSSTDPGASGRDRAAAGRAGRPDVRPGGAVAHRRRRGGRRGRGGPAGRTLGAQEPGVTGFTQWPPYVPPAPQGVGPVAARPPSARPGVRATGLRLLPAARPGWAWTAR